MPGIPHLRQNLRILRELIKAEFKLRYQHSYLGYVWTLIKPLLLFGVIYIVFSVFMPSPVPQYSAYLLLGIVLWNFFAEATLMGMSTFLAKRDLVTKIYFPRSILVFASTISNFITLLLNLLVVLIFLSFAGLIPGLEAIFFIIYLLELYAVATGVTFLLASLYVHFRDLQHIWEVLLQIGFWLTPIIYPVAIIPQQYQRLVFLNPLARIIEYSRDLFIHHHVPDLWLNLVLFGMTLVIFGAGYGIFRALSPRIAEKI